MVRGDSGLEEGTVVIHRRQPYAMEQRWLSHCSGFFGRGGVELAGGVALGASAFFEIELGVASERRFSDALSVTAVDAMPILAESCRLFRVAGQDGTDFDWRRARLHIRSFRQTIANSSPP